MLKIVLDMNSSFLCIAYTCSCTEACFTTPHNCRIPLQTQSPHVPSCNQNFFSPLPFPISPLTSPKQMTISQCWYFFPSLRSKKKNQMKFLHQYVCRNFTIQDWLSGDIFWNDHQIVAVQKLHYEKFLFQIWDAKFHLHPDCRSLLCEFSMEGC